MMTTEILQPIQAEARRIVAAAGPDLTLRLIGGVAIRAHAEAGLPDALERECQDIDLVTVRGAGGAVQRLLTGLGYEANTTFNTMNGADRLVFYDTTNRRQVDVFVGAFRMCHEIPVPRDRLVVDPVTLPLAELLLTKLQIHSANEKDLHDVYALVLEHDVRDDDDDAINGAVVARLLATDWGLWRTSKLTLERCREHLPTVGLDPASQALVLGRLDELWARVESHPKSMRWRSRSRVGDRMRWYEEPDEIAHRTS
jgi:hypothetical protein